MCFVFLKHEIHAVFPSLSGVQSPPRRHTGSHASGSRVCEDYDFSFWGRSRVSGLSNVSDDVVYSNVNYIHLHASSKGVMVSEEKVGFDCLITPCDHLRVV